MKLKFNFPFYLLFFILFFSCNSDNDGSIKHSIEGSSVIDTLKADVIKGYYTQFLKIMNTPDEQITEALKAIQYDVVFAKIEYIARDPFGKEKILSGVATYPVLSNEESSKALTPISLQHGTIAYAKNAPSKVKLANLSLTDILSFLPSALTKGYMVIQPDYFGYGSDETNPHYYELRSSLANATRGLIEVLPNYAKQQKLTINYDKLMLCGYSEGGFATLSTLKSLSEHASRFNTYVTVAGAGAYDKVATATEVLQQTNSLSSLFTASYSWVVLTYNSTYRINYKLNELFTSPVAKEMEKYTDNNLIMQTQTLPAAPSEVFSADFVKGIVDKSDKPFILALGDNNVSDFNAKGEVYLIHGDNDTWVPTFNTKLATERLKKRGVNVTEILYPGGDHESTYPVFLAYVIAKL